MPYREIAYLYLDGVQKYPDWSSTELVQMWIARDYGRRYLPLAGPFLFRETLLHEALKRGFTHAQGPACPWNGIRKIPEHYARLEDAGGVVKELKEKIVKTTLK